MYRVVRTSFAKPTGENRAMEWFTRQSPPEQLQRLEQLPPDQLQQMVAAGLIEKVDEPTS